MRQVMKRRLVLQMTKEQLATKAHVSVRDVEKAERYPLVDVYAFTRICEVLDKEETAALTRAWKVRDKEGA